MTYQTQQAMEREAFDDYWRRPYQGEKPGTGWQVAWDAWKARAALSPAAPAVGAPVAWSREFEVECDNIDEVLRHIGLDPDQCRTDGGALNVERIKTLLVPKEGTPEDQEFLRGLYLEVTRNGKVLTDQKRGLEEFSERATPPAASAEGVTDEQILDLAEKHLTPDFGDVLEFARALLAIAPAASLREQECPEGCEKMRGGKPVAVWRNDALEQAARIVEAYQSDEQIAIDIRAMKTKEVQ